MTVGQRSPSVATHRWARHDKWNECDGATAGAWPVEARRLVAETPESSGWVVRCEGPKASDVIPILVDDLIQQFRVLDSILDEPAGTKWVWDSEGDA